MCISTVHLVYKRIKLVFLGRAIGGCLVKNADLTIYQHVPIICIPIMLRNMLDDISYYHKPDSSSQKEIWDQKLFVNECNFSFIVTASHHQTLNTNKLNHMVCNDRLKRY